MGEVYLATDERLGRPVAIKILPATVAADPARQARFQRESKIVGSLSHPNIVAVYDVGAVDGVTFLVMELLEGRTLRSSLAETRPGVTGAPTDASKRPVSVSRRLRGGLPLRKALDIAAQVAQGLAAAHARGIVHRDLKPENIFLTSDGRVKILDFGVARAVAPVADDAPTGTGLAPTGQTGAGVVLGTVGYMAPEQVRGREVDHRVDIFALGAVLFEMLTGVRAFAAESTIETMSAILSADPLERRDLLLDVPAGVETIVRHCLEKQPDERFQSARDLAFQIQGLAAGSASSGEFAVLARPRTGWHPRAWLLPVGWVTIGALIASVGAMVWRPRDSSTPNAQVVHSVLEFDTTVVGARQSNTITIAPDGERVVFLGRGPDGRGYRLYQRRLDSPEAVAIPGTDAITNVQAAPSLSPDGKHVPFVAGGKLKTVAVDGGIAFDLCEAANLFGLTWGADDYIVFTAGSSGNLRRVRSTGGVPEKLSTVNRAAGEVGHVLPSTYLPDRRHMLFTVWYGSGRHHVALLDLTTRTHSVILENATNAVYAASGHLVYSRADGLYARPFDVTSLRLTGTEAPVVRDVYLGERTNLGQFAMSRNGTLIYRSGSPGVRELVLVDMDGTATALPGAPARRYAFPRFSADGQKIAVTIHEGPFNNIHVFDIARKTLTPLPLKGYIYEAQWGADSRTLVFRSDLAGAGQWKVYEQAADGGTPPKMIFDLGFSRFQTLSWTDRGRTLVGWGGASNDGVGNSIQTLSLDSRSPSPKELVAGQEGVTLYNARVSPDGQAIAYVSDRSGRPEVYVASYRRPQDFIQASTDGGSRVLWGHDSRRLFYLGPSNVTLMEVGVQLTPKLQTSLPRPRFPRAPYVVGDHLAFTNWDISPDGDHFVMLRTKQADADGEDPRVTHLNIIENFFLALNQKVPKR